MTESQLPTRRRGRKFLLALGLLAGLGLLGFWFLTTAAFWQQVGWRLVAAVQDRVNAQVSVGKISGNLITGMVFRDVKISRPQGDIIRARELEVSLSLLSFFRLQPVIRTLAVRQPEVSLRQEADGSWNTADLLKPLPPPPFSQIHLPSLEIDDGRVRVDRAGRQQVFQDITARLDLTIAEPGRPRQAVQIHQGSIGLTAPPYPRLQADFELTFGVDEILAPRLHISLAEAPVLYLEGSVKLNETPELNLSLKVPELSGARLRTLWPAWPEVFSVKGGLELRGPLDRLELTGAGALQDCRWQLSGSWQAPGEAPPEFTARVDFQNLTQKLVGAVYPAILEDECFTPVQGSLSISGHGRPWPPDNLQARLDLRPFSFGQAKLESAAATVKSTKDGQILGLKLQGNFGRLETEVSGQLRQLFVQRARVGADLKISAGDFNPAPLLGARAPQGAVNARFAGTVQIPPVPDWCQVSLNGTLQAAGKLLDYAFQDLTVKGALEEGELRLNPARLQMHNLRAEAQGRVSLAGADLKLTLDLQPPGPWPHLPPDLHGQLHSTGAIKGDWQALACQFDFQGKSLSWRQLALGSLKGRAAGTTSADAWRLASFDIQAQNLTTPVGRLGAVQAVGQTQGGNLVFEVKTPKNQGQSGALAGTAAWENRGARITITRFHWGAPKLQVTSVQPVTLSVGPGRFEISPLRLQYHKTFLSLSGKLAAEAVSLQAKLEHLDIADMARFLPQLAVVRGVINAQAEVAGPAANPFIKAQINVASGGIDTLALDSVQSTWLYRDSLLSLSGRIQEKPDKGAALAWQGTAPLSLSLLPWSWRLPDNGLQLRLWSENLTMSLLAALIPGVAAASGPLNLQVQAGGSLRQPLLSGTVRYGPGSLTIQPSGAPLAIEPGELRLQGNRLTVPRLAFHSGEGSGEITGGANVANLQLQDVQLTLKAVNLLMIQKEGSRAVASGQVSLKGSWPEFRSDGRLTVNEGQFRLSFFRSPEHSDIVLLPRASPPTAGGASPAAAASVVKNFLVNLVIDFPGNVWLRDKEVNGEIEGHIKVLRQVNGPAYLGGWVKAKEGVFTLNNKVFNVQKAMLLFPGEPHKPILIDARAERTVGEYTLFVTATGPLDNPRTGLESIPPLPPRDQLSLLVFDHLADKMTREEYVSITQKAMGILGSLTAQKLKTLLGGFLPFLGEVSPTSSREGVGVGKKLGKDITVSYERKLNPLPGEDLNQIRLDYRLNKYFSAETQLGRKNTGGDIFFNVDF